MKLSTRARYALRMMIDLADHADSGRPVVLKDIAERQQISKRYLEQLAISLKNARLLNVTTGRSGGYALRRDPADIQVGEIVEAAIGPIAIVDCVLQPDICGRADKCPTRDLWVDVNEQILGTLNKYTLADLSEKHLEHEAKPECKE